jgi:hypothetical protein
VSAQRLKDHTHSNQQWLTNWIGAKVSAAPDECAGILLRIMHESAEVAHKGTLSQHLLSLQPGQSSLTFGREETALMQRVLFSKVGELTSPELAEKVRVVCAPAKPPQQQGGQATVGGGAAAQPAAPGGQQQQQQQQQQQAAPKQVQPVASAPAGAAGGGGAAAAAAAGGGQTGNQPGVSSGAGGGGPQRSQYASEDIEEEANSYFQKIYTNQHSIEEVVNMLRSFKTSESQREQEIFACMVHNLFDEYRFFPKYVFMFLFPLAQPSASD